MQMYYKYIEFLTLISPRAFSRAELSCVFSATTVLIAIMREATFYHTVYSQYWHMNARSIYQ